MPQLLLEFFGEEIPARMQKRAEEDLAKAFGEKLKAAGLEPKAIKTFSSPRRLGLVIDDLLAKAADVNEEKKGPRVGAPDQAVQGFLKSAGLSSIDQAQVVEDKKGAFYVARIQRAGGATAAIVQQITPEIVCAFPWPKSMRSQSSDLQWVRPLHNVLCLFDGAPVKIEIEGVGAKPETWGHRFHAAGPIKPKNFEDYAAKLREARVLIDREERKSIIMTQAKQLCAAKGLELVEDPGLLEEVCGLVEWPVTLLGDMDPAFLDLPGEVIRLSMRTHQKYFAVRDPKTQKLAPHFITVANVEAKDGGAAIAAGNARVLSARLNDARYFWDVDRFYDAIEKKKPKPLDAPERKEKLKQIVFHQKLGSVWDKVERVKALAVELCAVTGADPKLVERAAELCKMDLVTETVGEFPELQGQIGRVLAELSAPSPLAGEGREGGRSGLSASSPSALSSDRPSPPTPSPQGRGGREHASVAIAIEDHYRPLGPNDRVPSDPVAVTLALADKLDTLSAFFAIDEKPTGSSDPYALRRAALGFVAILLSGRVRLPLQSLTRRTIQSLVVNLFMSGRIICSLSATEFHSERPDDETFEGAVTFCFKGEPRFVIGKSEPEAVRKLVREDRAEFADAICDPTVTRWTTDINAADGAIRRRGVTKIPDLHVTQSLLLAFLADRLKVQLRDQGKRHDLVDAVFALGDDDLVRIVARVEALDAFLITQDGANLLAGYKRAANILAAEEKKGKGLSAADLAAGLDVTKLTEPAEKALHAALEQALPAARAAVETEDFAAAMKALAGLRAPVDAFFEGVLVNAEDALLRRNRLLLLARLREALSAVADFSKIEG